MDGIANNIGEIVMYQPDNTVRLEVRVENETVWLTQQQMADLFVTTKQNVSLHVNNIFREKELEKDAVVKESLTTAKDGKRYKTNLYNLDVIISVGYRVKSLRGTQFRQWANKILKDYMLRGYVVNSRILALEQQVAEHGTQLKEMQGKIDFFVRSSLPPVEGVLYEGKIFDAYKLVEALVKSAQKEIILIDNYLDASIFDLLEKREQGTSAPRLRPWASASSPSSAWA